MNCTPIWAEHVDRQRRTATGHGHKPAKDKFGANYKCRQRQKWLAWIGSDRIGSEREGSGAGRHQLVGGLPNVAAAAAAAAATHSLLRGRGSGSWHTGWRSWMKQPKHNTQTLELVGEAVVQVRICSWSWIWIWIGIGIEIRIRIRMRIRIRIRNMNLLLILFSVVFALFVVALAICEVWN